MARSRARLALLSIVASAPAFAHQPYAPGVAAEPQAPEVSSAGGHAQRESLAAGGSAADPDWWRDAFVTLFGEGLRRHLGKSGRLDAQFPNATNTPTTCHTIAALDAWLARQQARIAAFVPPQYQSIPMAAMDQQYNESRARILQELGESDADLNNTDPLPGPVALLARPAPDSERPEENMVHHQERIPGGLGGPRASADVYFAAPRDMTDPIAWRDAFAKMYSTGYGRYLNASERLAQRFPTVARSAAACHSVSALNEWRDAQRARIEAFVPQEYRALSEGAVEKQYEEHKARLRAELGQAASEPVEQGGGAAARGHQEEPQQQAAAAPPSPRGFAAVAAAALALAAAAAVAVPRLRAAGGGAGSTGAFGQRLLGPEVPPAAV